jgi:hypothetical protein
MRPWVRVPCTVSLFRSDVPTLFRPCSDLTVRFMIVMADLRICAPPIYDYISFQGGLTGAHTGHTLHEA